MTGRRQVESPRDLPWLRHELIRALGYGSDFAKQMGPDLAGRIGLTDDTAREASAISASLRDADLYWVTADMTRVALDGASDLPAWSAGVAAPSPAGLLLWRGGLPPLTVTPRLAAKLMIDATTLPLDGVTWSRVRGEVRIILLTSGVMRRPLERYDDRLPPMRPITSYSLPIFEPPTPVAAVHSYLPDVVGITALIGATWIMMQQPTVATSRPVRPGARDESMARTLGASRPLVTAVDLRVLASSQVGRESCEPGRHLTVRHVVRGHWRQQYHPSDGSHRPRWIASYVKGPEGAPLHLSQPVMVWRR